LVEAGGSGPDAWGTHFPENKRPFGAGSKLDPGAGIVLGIAMLRLVPVLLLWLCVPVQAADPVIAVVDFKKVLASHPKARELEAELRATQENAKKVFEAKQRELKELQIKLQKAAVPLKTKEGDTEENRQAFLDLEERGMEIQQSMVEVQAKPLRTGWRRSCRNWPARSGNWSRRPTTGSMQSSSMPPPCRGTGCPR
jgi:hypothetical protein